MARLYEILAEASKNRGDKNRGGKDNEIDALQAFLKPGK
jgi:hypothetical protein